MKIGDLVRVKKGRLYAGQIAVVESTWDQGNMVLLKFLADGRSYWYMLDEVETPDDLT